MAQRPGVAELTDGVRKGDRRLLAKAISLVESSRTEDLDAAQEMLERLLPCTGKSWRIGISGVPGVGKSTFIDSFGMHLCASGRRVAVLTIDPSSERTGGSILGDKTRMPRLAKHPNAYIRPSPSGGSLGGVARKTRESTLLCEAAGYDCILIETVGVGQSETSVANMADFFLVLMLAGAGDELQGIKRGIMEMADAIVITKADGDNVRPAGQARPRLANALHLLQARSPEWQPEVLTCSAMEERGIDEVLQLCRRFFEAESRAGIIQRLRMLQQRTWMHALVETELRALAYSIPDLRGLIPEMEQTVSAGQKSPTAAAMEILAIIRARLAHKP